MSNCVRCSRCGKPVSREVEGDLVVRAFVECPECVEKLPDTPKTEGDWSEYAQTLGTENKRLRTELAMLRGSRGIELSVLLSELEKALVVERGWEMEDGTANRIMECLMQSRTTFALSFFMRWMNSHAEARGVLADMGVGWRSEDAEEDL